MKKITIYLLMLFSVSVFSQVEIVEDFEAIATNQVPTGWTYTSNFRVSTSTPCDGSTRSARAVLNANGEATLVTSNYVGISNGTELTISFSYNIFEGTAFPPVSYSAPTTGWGSLVLEYSTDGGTNWANITTINDSNYTYSGSDTTCGSATANVSAGTLANGSDFQARFVMTRLNAASANTLVVVDNISITQEATTVPNCDAVLTSPANGATGIDTNVNLQWSTATGLPDGYTLSVGTTSGGTDIVNGDLTTATSYTLSGLDFDTTYYVNIVPYNGFGPATTGCSEESFTTRSAPVPGATCGSPLEISTLTPSTPYVHVSNTANYEDNIDVSPCSNSYMAGKDVYYQITPSADMSINIDVTGIDNNGPSIHVLDGCPDVATTCVAYTGIFTAPGGALNLSDIVLFAGNTYFIVLSNSGSTRTYNYVLVVSQNTCINPEMTLTAVSDCGNGQFSVDVDVTYMGDASSLTLQDDFGNSNNSITTTGVITMGPYPSTSTVNFTLLNNDDNSCVYNDSIFYYCPPANDECSGSIALTVDNNGDTTCDNLTAGTNGGATHSGIATSVCGTSGTNDVWYSFVAESTTMVIEYFNVTAIGSGGSIQATEVLEGTCDGTLTSIKCQTGNYIFLSGLTLNDTYYIRNYSNSSGTDGQTYDICIKTGPAAPANDECSNAITLPLSTDEVSCVGINGTTYGATTSSELDCTSPIATYGDVWLVFTPPTTGMYEFKFTNNTGTSSYYKVYRGSCGSLTGVTNCAITANSMLFLDGSETYYIAVYSSQAAAPGGDFEFCVWQLPDAVGNSECSTPFVLAESPDFNGANSVTADFVNAYYSSEGCASSSYESIWYTLTPTYTGTYHFDFTRVSGSANYTVYNTDNCSNTGSAGYIPNFSSCYNSADRTGDVVAGTTYLIFVSSSAAAQFTLFAYPDPSLSTASVDFESFKYYPNPVENTLTVEAANPISEIRIYNFIGQQVHTVMPNSMSSIINTQDLTNGVYFVTVTINNSQKTFKVVKK